MCKDGSLTVPGAGPRKKTTEHKRTKILDNYNPQNTFDNRVSGAPVVTG